MKLKHYQNGNMLIIAVALIVVVGVFGAFAVRMLTSISTSSSLITEGNNSFYLAESGLEYGMLQIKNNLNINNPTAYCDGNWKTVQSLGEGQFQFSCAQYTGSTTTTTALDSVTLIIPVASLSGFSPIGRVVIDNEKIDYAGTSTSTAICGGGNANCIIATARGVDDTTAATHIANTTISQTQLTSVVQLLIQSQGSTPTIANPQASKTLQKSIVFYPSFKYAWAVGNSGAVYQQIGVNGSWARYTTLGTQNLNAISCSDANHCWTVGNAGASYVWNGTSWGAAPSPTTNNLISITCPINNYCVAGDSLNHLYSWNGAVWTLLTITPDANQVVCASALSCISVGTNGSIARWDGSSWTLVTSGTTSNLASVSCPSVNVCYAVGSSQTILKSTNGGVSWVQQAYPSNLDKDVYTISCGDINHCWAFGSGGGGSKNFYDATVSDGVTWTSPDLAIQNKKPSSVYCLTPDYCFLSSDRMDANEAYIATYRNGVWTSDIFTDTPSAQNINAVASDYNANSPTYGVTAIAWREVFN